MEWLFTAFYMLELVLKVIVHRLQFFGIYNGRFPPPDDAGSEWKWNLFDLFLVLTALYDGIVQLTLDDRESAGANMTWMRLLRLLKMLKMLRVVRLMRFFRELRLMFFTIGGSFRSLLWAMTMLFMINYIFALCFMQGASAYL